MKHIPQENGSTRFAPTTRSIADAVRNPKLIDRSVAIEAMKAALAARKTTPGALADAAKTYRGARMILTYLEALTSNG